MDKIARRFSSLACQLFIFVRFSIFNVTAMFPLLGALTAWPAAPLEQLAPLIAVAFSFHIFAYVLNDVVDMPIDRTEKLRQDSLLVRGVVTRRFALIIALLQIPIAFLITLFLRGGVAAYVSLSISFLLAAVYDLWGKKCPIPLLTDVILATSCCAFTLYGVFATNHKPTPLTGILLAFVFVLALMVNGVHGGLKDLENDLSSGALTTAIKLGAMPSACGVALSFRIKLYAGLLQLALIILSLLSVVTYWDNTHTMFRALSVMGMGGCGLISFILLFLGAKSTCNKHSMIRLGATHLAVSLGSLLVPFTPDITQQSYWLLVFLYLFPVLIMWRLFLAKLDDA